MASNILNDLEEKVIDIVNSNVEPYEGNNYLYVKRALDIIFSLILLIIAIPFIIVFAIAIRIETPGNPFYSQERVGTMGKPIKITKLRSMYSGIEKKSGAMWAQKNDARITKAGKIIRKTRIDELPQLLSVLKGDMSLIGPRPERPNFVIQFSEEVPGFEQRLRIKPGLSGWAQVNGGYEDSPAGKLKNDLYYISHLSFKTDFIVFLKTIGVVFTGEGAR